MDSYSSAMTLNFLAIKPQETQTPKTSPITIQKALTHIKAPIPVTPISNHPDSPVALADKAAIQYPSFLPPT